MQHQKEEKRQRDPEPVDLHEEDVEDVALAREVARRFRGRVRLRDGVVGGVAGRGVEDGEEGAEEEGRGVGGQEEGFERGGKEGFEEAGRASLSWACVRGGGGRCGLLGRAAVAPDGR